MLFNSIEFAIFLSIVFFLYWFVVSNNIKKQNLLIVISSYVFYGWWDWRFLSLIVISTIIDYSIGLGLCKQENPRKRKILLWGSILVNLGLLGIFKYFNFFLDSLFSLMPELQNKLGFSMIKLILPVGISFYTFQTLSYSIDVYKRKLKPTRDFIAFSAFVSFFPQLVAGPIERATNLLPQFLMKRTFNYNNAVNGLRQILWGLFKKIVIADNCAIYVNQIFNNSSDYNGSTIVIGAVFFTFQVYGDFSGYSDIAIGTARLFGFKLMRNFAFPFFSRDIAEFWRRWHISLTTWFRDYLYFPIGGSRGGTLKKIRNIFIIFIVSGFWHGANWTFIIFGALHAIYFIPLLLTKKNRNHLEIVASGRMFPNVWDILQMTMTFLIFSFSLIIFRAIDVKHAFSLVAKVFSTSIIKIPYFDNGTESIPIIIVCIVFIIIEWIGREEQYAIEILFTKTHRMFRWTFYYGIIISMIYFTSTGQQFIYFQF